MARSIRKRRLRVHGLRVLAFFAVFGGIHAYYRFLGNFWLLFAQIFAVFLVISDFLLFAVLARNLKIWLSVPRGTATAGEAAEAVLHCRNLTPSVCLGAEVKLGTENLFTGERGGVEFIIAVSPARDKKLSLPLISERCGAVRAWVESAAIKDLLGWFSWTLDGRGGEDAEVLVLPEETGRERREDFPAGREKEMQVSIDRKDDCPEIKDVREYIQGDRMRDIHWKLSAGAGGLIVKEYESETEKYMTVLAECGPFPEAAHETAVYLWRFCCESLERGVRLRLLWPGEHRGYLEEGTAAEQGELIELFGRLLREKSVGRQEGRGLLQYAEHVPSCLWIGWEAGGVTSYLLEDL